MQAQFTTSRHPRVTRTCQHCGQTFLAHQSAINRGAAKFCGRHCAAAKRPRRPLSERFWQHFQRAEGPKACWPWEGALSSDGYGMVRDDDGKRVRAHRVAYELQVGPIPDGQWVLHRCDNPPCVRGDHLFPGTNHDNLRDMWRKHRGPHGDTHGARKHPESRPRGSANGRAKLTEDQVRAIRQQYAVGNITIKTLAAEYGVAETGMGRIVRGTSWRQAR